MLCLCLKQDISFQNIEIVLDKKIAYLANLSLLLKNNFRNKF